MILRPLRHLASRTWLPFVALTLLAALLAPGIVGPGPAAAREASYQHFDVQLVVQPNGDFRITETISAHFDGGPFSEVYRILTLPRTTGIGDISVVEIVNGARVPYTQSTTARPNTFRIIERAPDIEVAWTFDTTYTASRVWVLAYTEFGALRSYPDASPPNQQIWFTPIGGVLTRGVAIDAATFRITLPAAIDPADVVLAVDKNAVDDPADYATGDRTFTFTHGRFSGGDSWEIRLQVPIVAPDAPIPPWQASDDIARAAADRETAVDGIALLVAVFIAVAGSIAIFVLWYTRGRDPQTGLVADFLSAPPDDTPAGVVGALIDERVDERDLVATLMDLGRRKLVSIDIAPGKEITFRRIPGEPATPIERALLGMLFPDTDLASDATPVVTLTRAAAALRSQRTFFTDAIYADLVTRGYYDRSPNATRARWRSRAIAIALVSVAVSVPLAWLVSPWMAAPPLAIAALAFALRLTGRRMPRRTRAGADAAATWRAFRRYLQDLEKYDRVDAARANFEAYLPYAVAFGLESVWLARFQHADAPEWFDMGDLDGVPTTWPRGPHIPHGPVVITTGGHPQGWNFPGVGMPDLGNINNSAASNFDEGSGALKDILSAIGVILDITSFFAGGGRSGGSSGGGGGGFR